MQSIPRFFLLALLVQGTCFAATETGVPGGWRVNVTGAHAGQPNSSLGENADFRVDRSVMDMSANRRLGNRWFGGVSLGYEEDHYRFSGVGSDRLWDDIRYLKLGLSLRYLANEDWSIFGFPVLRYSAEEGASLSEAQETGLLAGATYRVSHTLSIGPGFGYFSGIGETDDLFPILLVKWQITETLALETGRGLAASRGPGLVLKWRPEQDREFGLAIRYEKSRFRLEGDEMRIGQDRAIPLIATATWHVVRKLTLSALASVKTSGRLDLESRDGRILQRLDYDAVPLVGLVAKYQF